MRPVRKITSDRSDPFRALNRQRMSSPRNLTSESISSRSYRDETAVVRMRTCCEVLKAGEMFVFTSVVEIGFKPSTVKRFLFAQELRPGTIIERKVVNITHINHFFVPVSYNRPLIQNLLFMYTINMAANDA